MKNDLNCDIMDAANPVMTDVDAPDKSSGKRKQHIHIKYDGVGFIPLSMRIKEETA